MSLPHSPAATALIALTQTLTLSAAQEHDLQEHDLPRLCLDVPHAIFLVTLSGTHLLVSKSPESQKLLAYHLAHSSAAYVLEQGQFQQATPAQATAYLNGLPPVYVIEAPADRQVLLIRSLSGTPDPVVLPRTSPLYAQAQHLLARRPAFARDAAGHRAHVQHQQRVVELYGQVAHPAPPSRTVPQAPSALSTSALPKSWGTKRYPEDLEYVITHMVEGGQATILIETASVQAHFDAIRHDPWTRQLHSTSSAQFTLLARMTIAAGTSWPDALAQLTARVPSVYRDLPSSVYLPDKKGERVVSLPR